MTCVVTMLHDKSMERIAEIDKLLRQFPQGMSASEIAKKIGVRRTTVYDDLNSLKLRFKAENKEGLWFPFEKPKQNEDITLETRLRLIELAVKLASSAPPEIARDVTFRIGKEEIGVKHE